MWKHTQSTALGKLSPGSSRPFSLKSIRRLYLEDWLDKGLNESTEQIHTEIFFFRFGFRGLLDLLGCLLLDFRLFLFLFLVVLLASSGSTGSCTNVDFAQTFADDLGKWYSTSSTFLLLRDLRTASTWASSMGFPVALRIALIESLAILEGHY